MVQISVRQYINGAWVSLSSIHMGTVILAIDYIDDLQRKLVSDSPGTITLRANVDELLVVNLNHGPLQLTIHS